MLAPVILFVYNRPEHTRRTLEALSKNSLANHSKLIIFSDGYKLEDSQEKKQMVDEVRQVIVQKEWCKEVEIIRSEKNKGLTNSIIEGLNYVFEKYNAAIILEDDIVTATSFLDFMNKNLEFYKGEENVFGISGFCYPNTGIYETTYFLPIGSSWGWATWKDKWLRIRFDAKALLMEINDKKLKRKLNFKGMDFYSMLKTHALNTIDTWDIQFYASFFLQKGVFLFPNVSLVENIGFDSTGIHCSQDNFFDSVSSNELWNYERIRIVVKKEIVKKILLVPKRTVLNSLYEKLNHLKNGLQ